MLEKLKQFAYVAPPHLPGFMGKAAMQGCRGPCNFIATEDHDGHIEVSLSIDGPLPPTDAQVSAFFRFMGVSPVAETRIRRIRHFVLRRGKLN